MNVNYDDQIAGALDKIANTLIDIHEVLAKRDDKQEPVIYEPKLTDPHKDYIEQLNAYASILDTPVIGSGATTSNVIKILLSETLRHLEAKYLVDKEYMEPKDAHSLKACIRFIKDIKQQMEGK